MRRGRLRQLPAQSEVVSGNRDPIGLASAACWGYCRILEAAGVANIQVEMGIGPPTGAAFPSWELRDQAGQAIDLIADRAGRGALVVFHRSAAW